MLVLLACVPADLAAQTCNLEHADNMVTIAGGAVIYLSRPTFDCGNGTTIAADSGVYVKSVGRIDFMGRVRFNEPDRSLTAQNAQYVGREHRLMAQQNVVLTDRASGTILRSPTLDYFQKSASNPDPRIEVYSGRPHATLVRKRADASGVDTTNVDSDRMQIIAEKMFRGWGSVDVKRGKLTSRSNYAEFDQDGNFMRLYGQANIVSDTFKVTADSIDADLVNGDTFKELRARINARIDSKSATVEAPIVRVTFDKGEVQRLIALGGAKAKDPKAQQAKSVSQDFTLIADSIDVKSPGQKLESVIAVGHAAGERKPDTLDAKLPATINRDWVRGDTVQAFFTDTKPDTARVLQRIVANGSPASSTYRLRQKVKDSQSDSTEMSVNYLTAHHIDVVMKNGAVDVVRAQGDIHGIYLQKPPKAQPAKGAGTGK